MIKRTTLVGVMLCLGLAMTSRAATVSYSVSLDGLQETPPVATPASGSATLSYDTVTGILTLNAMSFSGLIGTATASHIHGPAPVGTPAGVLIPLTGVPVGSSSGVVPTQSFGPLTATHLGYLTGGLLYINLHSTYRPGGEIRGQILPAAVPLPGAGGAGLAMLGGLGAVRMLMRRRAV